MPWSEVSVMDLRLEFVMLAEQPGSNVSALCRRFGISRKTGYKWLGPSWIGGGSVGSIAATPLQSAAHAGGDGGCSSGGAIGPSVLGRTQDRPPASGPGRDGCTGAIDGDGDPAAPWRRLGAGRNACRLPALRALAAERALADGLQRPFCLGSGSLPSVDRAGRLLALQPVPGGLRQRAGRDGARASAGSIPSLWPAGVDHRRQRLALGRWTEHADHAARRLVSAPRHRPQSQPSLSSSDAGQGRALPPHAESRTPGRSAFRRSRALPAGLRPLAHRLQLRAAPSGPRLGRAGCPIPTQSASLPRGPAAHRVRARTSGPPRPGQRPHQLQRQDIQTAQGVRRIPGPDWCQPPTTEHGR